jgi:hypothetical protein
MIVDVVEDFGADLAGGSNSTPAFVAAVDAVTRRGGGIIDIPAGLYRIDDAPLIVRAAEAAGVALISDVLPEFRIFEVLHQTTGAIDAKADGVCGCQCPGVFR